MIFTSQTFVVFFVVVFAAHWLLPRKSWQNVLLLAVSYFFYGYIHPWFCLLIAFSSLLDFSCGLGMSAYPARRRVFLVLSLVGNLGVLGVFKYFNFFAQNVQSVLGSVGFAVHPVAFKIFLPVGISFYTFKTLSYTIDVYRGKMKPCRNLIDHAVFVSLFPALLSGPIDRATELLPQVQSDRRWRWELLYSAWPLLVRGCLKKMVVADNLATYADKVYMLEHPSVTLLAAGTIAFTFQLYADFSGYTDLARGFGRLLGFELMENFDSPYLSVSPSDFWRRWHISLSSWIRDYVYIPFGGSRVAGWWRQAAVVLAAMGLCGLWHGAAWTFVIWGLYHGALLFVYRVAGFGGRWAPDGALRRFLAWAVMLVLVAVGWAMFRAPDMEWLLRAVLDPQWGFSGDAFAVSLSILALTAMYAMPLLGLLFLDRVVPEKKMLHALFYAACVLVIAVFHRPGGQDFIYFQF